MDPMDIVGKSKEDVSLPKSTMTKIIKEMLPPDVRVARDTQDLLVECCVEFINLLSSESNDVCSRDDKKTIAPEHVIRALQDLGFKEYVEEVYAAYEHHKLDTLDSPKASKFTGIEMTEEEAVAEQQRMFAEARARMNNGAAKPKELASGSQNQPQLPPQPQLQLHPQAQQPPPPQPQLYPPQSQQPLQPQQQPYTQAQPQQPLQPPLQLHPQAQPEQPLQPQSSGSTTATCAISTAAPSATISAGASAAATSAPAIPVISTAGPSATTSADASAAAAATSTSATSTAAAPAANTSTSGTWPGLDG